MGCTLADGCTLGGGGWIGTLGGKPAASVARFSTFAGILQGAPVGMAVGVGGESWRFGGTRWWLLHGYTGWETKAGCFHSLLLDSTLADGCMLGTGSCTGTLGGKPELGVSTVCCWIVHGKPDGMVVGVRARSWRFAWVVHWLLVAC